MNAHRSTPTKDRQWILLTIVGAALALAPDLTAAVGQRSPHVGYVYPAGGRQGTRFEVALGGQYLKGATAVDVSGAGVEMKVLAYDRPLLQKRANEMREKLRGVRQEMETARKSRRFSSPREGMELFLTLAEQQGMSLEELEKLVEFQRQRQDPRRQLNPQLAEVVTVEVTIAADAEPGPRELRLVTWSRLSNPLIFSVGQLPETREVTGRPELTWEELAGLRRRKPFGSDSGGEIQRVGLPSMVNGQILPGEVDRFRFTARKGQKIVAGVQARALIPYLADAVPGWFQSTVALYDAKGLEVAYADDFRFHPDPVLCYEIPRAGTYTIEIKDSIYRGREDFVYRIGIGELPFITGIFPLGGEVGRTTSIRLSGWNLPATRMSLRPESVGAGQMGVSVSREGNASNRARFAVGSTVEQHEREPNNMPRDAQLLELPLVVNGRIRESGDWDVFRLEGRAGEVVVAEVFARRLDSPIDSILKLTDSQGCELASNDDYQDRAAGLTTHHSDSRLDVRLPLDGVYYLHLGDAQGRGGEAYAYRLQLGAPNPGFALRVVPSSVNIRAGSSVPLGVHVLRRDGFTNEIKLALAVAPPGFSLVGERLNGDTNQFRVLLKVSPNARRQNSAIRLEGRALLDGRELVNQAVPADDLMQAFIYRHLVPAQELKVAVSRRAPAKKAGQKSEAPGTPAAKPVASK